MFFKLVSRGARFDPDECITTRSAFEYLYLQSLRRMNAGLLTSLSIYEYFKFLAEEAKF